VFTHAAPQGMAGAVQVDAHTELTQNGVGAAHALPHVPQFNGSDAKLAQTAPHWFWTGH
jgi:hypothetical protein